MRPRVLVKREPLWAFPLVLITIAAIVAIALSIIAIVKLPDVPTMGIAPDVTRRKRSSPKCPYGSDVLLWYIDLNGDSRYDQTIDRLLYEQEVCTTASIPPIINGLSHRVDSIEHDTAEHLAFRSVDEILTSTTNNLDRDRLEMQTQLGDLTNRVSSTEQTIIVSNSERNNLRSYDQYLDGRVMVLEEKEILSYGRLSGFDQNISSFNNRITLLEASQIGATAGNVSDVELLQYLLMTNNQTQTKLTLLEDHIIEDEHKFAEVKVDISQLKTNHSHQDMEIAELKGCIQGVSQNVSVLEVWKPGVQTKFDLLLQSDITIGNRIDNIQLKITDVNNTLFGHVNRMESFDNRMTFVESFGSETATSLALLQNGVEEKIREFSLVQSNQTSIWQRIGEFGLIKDVVLTKLNHLEETQTDILSKLNISIIEGITNDEFVANQVVENRNNIQITNISLNRNIADISSLSSQVASISGQLGAASVTLASIGATLDARGIILNNTLGNIQTKVAYFQAIADNHETRIVSSEMDVVNNAAATALNTAKIDTLFDVQNEHNTQLASLALNNTLILGTQQSNSERLTQVEQKSYLNYLEIAKLKTDLQLITNVSTPEANFTDILEFQSQIGQLENRITQLENRPTQAPTPQASSSSPVCMYGFVYGNGTLGYAHNSDVVRTGVGRYTITFGNSLSSIHYAVFIQPEEDNPSSGPTDDIQMHVITSTRTTNHVSLHGIRQDLSNGNQIPYEDRSFSYQILC